MVVKNMIFDAECLTTFHIFLASFLELKIFILILVSSTIVARTICLSFLEVMSNMNIGFRLRINLLLRMVGLLFGTNIIWIVAVPSQRRAIIWFGIAAIAIRVKDSIRPINRIELDGGLLMMIRNSIAICGWTKSILKDNFGRHKRKLGLLWALDRSLVSSSLPLITPPIVPVLMIRHHF